MTAKEALKHYNKIIVAESMEVLLLLRRCSRCQETKTVQAAIMKRNLRINKVTS